MQPKVYSAGEGYRDEQEWKVCLGSRRNHLWGDVEHQPTVNAPPKRKKKGKEKNAGTHFVLPVAAQEVLGHVRG